METRPDSFFIDIDGTLIKYDINVIMGLSDNAVLLPGVKRKIDEWLEKGCKIVLTTGRSEDRRGLTERQLAKLGIKYHHLIMGLGGGVRKLINDTKPDGTITALAYSIERDSGFVGRDDL